MKHFYLKFPFEFKIKKMEIKHLNFCLLYKHADHSTIQCQKKIKISLLFVSEQTYPEWPSSFAVNCQRGILYVITLYFGFHA